VVLHHGGWAYPEEGTVKDKAEYIRKSKLAFTLLLKNVSPALIEPLRAYVDNKEPATDSWGYLERTFRSTDVYCRVTLTQQLSNIKMGPQERNDEYLNRGRALREQIRAVGLTVDDAQWAVQDRLGST